MIRGKFISGLLWKALGNRWFYRYGCPHFFFFFILEFFFSEVCWWSLTFVHPTRCAVLLWFFKELKIKGETHSRLEGDAGGGSVRGVISIILVWRVMPYHPVLLAQVAIGGATSAHRARQNRFIFEIPEIRHWNVPAAHPRTGESQPPQPFGNTGEPSRGSEKPGLTVVPLCCTSPTPCGPSHHSAVTTCSISPSNVNALSASVFCTT